MASYWRACYWLAIATSAGVSATASPLAERDLGAIDGAWAEFHAVDNRGYLWSKVDIPTGDLIYRSGPLKTTTLVLKPAGFNFPDAAMSPDGSVIALKSGTPDGFSYAERTVFPANAGWDTTTVTTSGDINGASAFLFDASGQPALLWTERLDPDTRQLKLTRRNAAGSWTTEPGLTLANILVSRVHAAFSGAVLHAVIYDQVGDVLFYVRRSATGTWFGDGVLTEAEAVPKMKMLVHPITGEPWIWASRRLEGESGQSDYFYRFDPSTSDWQERPIFTSLPSLDEGIDDVVFFSDGTLYAIDDPPAQNFNARVRFGDPLGLAAPKSIDFDADVNTGRVAVDAAGNPSLVHTIPVGTRDPHPIRLRLPSPESDINGNGFPYLEEVAFGFPISGFDGSQGPRFEFDTDVTGFPPTIRFVPALVYQRPAGGTVGADGSYVTDQLVYTPLGFDDFTPLPTTSSMADGSIIPNGDNTETATVKRRVNRNSRRGQIISLQLEIP